MGKPWFNLDPTNSKDPWWLYTSIINTNTANMLKNDHDIICYVLVHDNDVRGEFYRVSTWLKNDPNRYLFIKYEYNWGFSKLFKDMNEGDIIHTDLNNKFKVYNCRFLSQSQNQFCKILERIN